MSALSQIIANVVERLLFYPLTVIRVEAVGEHFRLLHVQGDDFKGVKGSAGQKVQIMVGPLTKRAYTPMDFDPVAGSASFLLHLHGDGPGSSWAAAVKAGDLCQAMRPQDSLDFQNLSKPTLFFGDETSLAAARVLNECQEPGTKSQFLFEVRFSDEANHVSRGLSIANAEFVEKRQDGSHLPRLISKLTERAALMQSPQWVFTGQARSIQSIRKGLKQAGVSVSKSKVKAYWSLGKAGLD